MHIAVASRMGRVDWNNIEAERLDNMESRPAWDAWIEIILYWANAHVMSSRPAWDAWIEINQ